MRRVLIVLLLLLTSSAFAAGPTGPSISVYEGVNSGDYWHEFIWDFPDVALVPNGYWHNKFTYHHPIGPYIGEETRGLFETFTVFDLADATESGGLLSNNYSQFTLQSLGIAPETTATAARFVYQGTGIGGVDVTNGFISLYDDVGSTVAPLSFTHYRARTPGVTIGGGTFYGLYIENQLGQYGVYQAGTTDSNVFFGKVGIGKVPTVPFDFTGTVSGGRIVQYNGTGNANGGESAENHDYTINMAPGSSFFDDHGVVSYTFLVNVDQNYDFVSDSVYGVSISNSVQKSIANPIGLGGLKVTPAFSNNSASVLDTGIGVEVQWAQNAGNLKYATGLTVQPSVIAVGASISNFAGVMLGNDAGFGVVQSQNVPNLFTGNVRIGGAAFTWGVLAAPTPIRQLDVRGGGFFASPVQVGVTPTSTATATGATPSSTATATQTATPTPTPTLTPTATLTIFVGATPTATLSATATPTGTATTTPLPQRTADMAIKALEVAGDLRVRGVSDGAYWPMVWADGATATGTGTTTTFYGGSVASSFCQVVAKPMTHSGCMDRLMCSTNGAPAPGLYDMRFQRITIADANGGGSLYPGVAPLRLVGSPNPNQQTVDFAEGALCWNVGDKLCLRADRGATAPASINLNCTSEGRRLDR